MWTVHDVVHVSPIFRVTQHIKTLNFHNVCVFNHVFHVLERVSHPKQSSMADQKRPQSCVRVFWSTTTVKRETHHWKHSRPDDGDPGMNGKCYPPQTHVQSVSERTMAAKTTTSIVLFVFSFSFYCLCHSLLLSLLVVFLTLWCFDWLHDGSVAAETSASPSLTSNSHHMNVRRVKTPHLLIKIWSYSGTRLTTSRVSFTL